MTQGRRLELSWFEHDGQCRLLVHGWTGAELQGLSVLSAAELGRRLAVLPSELVEAGSNLPGGQSLAGRFVVGHDAVWFVPRFPFVDSLSYSLIVHSPVKGRPIDGPEMWTIQRPVPAAGPTTSVAAIYPSAEELPVNLLKLYVHFSGPMSEGWAAQSVRVRRKDDGAPLDGVFLAMEPELWDRERRRLTLLLDPGRIKRGLAPNTEAGYPLTEGVPVIVGIDSEFRDAAGRPLGAGAERPFMIDPPVRTRVNPADWRYRCPAVGSTDPLTVEFDRPLDHALLQHSIWVHDSAGAALAGQGSVGPGERSWRFHPQLPWDQGRHVVVVDPRLEDLAGNSPIRVFDRDLTCTEDAPADGRHAAIGFTCDRDPHVAAGQSPLGSTAV